MVSKIVKAHQEVRDLVLLFQGIPEQIPMEMKTTFCRQSQEAHKANASVKSIEDGLTDGWQMYPLLLTVYQHTYRLNFLC